MKRQNCGDGMVLAEMAVQFYNKWQMNRMSAYHSLCATQYSENYSNSLSHLLYIYMKGQHPI